MAYLDKFSNFAKCTVSIGYNSAATSIVLSSGEGSKLPSSTSYNLVWWNATDYADPSDDPLKEIVRVTARTTDTLTVTRAQESTSAQNHNTSAKTYKMVLSGTAKLITDIETKLDNLDVSAVAAYLASNQSISAGATTIIGTGVSVNEDIDELNEFDSTTNFRFTPTKGGIYHVSASIVFTATAAAEQFLARVYKNGTTIWLEDFQFSRAAENVSLKVAGLVKLVTTDYLDLRATNSTAGSRTVVSGRTSTWFHVAAVAVGKRTP